MNLKTLKELKEAWMHNRQYRVISSIHPTQAVLNTVHSRNLKILDDEERERETAKYHTGMLQANRYGNGLLEWGIGGGLGIEAKIGNFQRKHSALHVCISGNDLPAFLARASQDDMLLFSRSLDVHTLVAHTKLDIYSIITYAELEDDLQKGKIRKNLRLIAATDSRGKLQPHYGFTEPRNQGRDLTNFQMDYIDIHVHDIEGNALITYDEWGKKTLRPFPMFFMGGYYPIGDQIVPLIDIVYAEAVKQEVVAHTKRMFKVLDKRAIFDLRRIKDYRERDA